MPQFDPFGESLSSGNQYQRQQDWFEQRKEFRAAALTALRKREGLPLPVDEHGAELETRFDDQGNAHYYNAAGQRVERVMWQGVEKHRGFAVGKKKGEERGLADTGWTDLSELAAAKTVEATMRAAKGIAPFEILELAEDGRKLEDELRDLDRDAAGMEMAERVSHGATGEQAPGFRIDNTSGEEVERRLQEYIKQGRNE